MTRDGSDDGSGGRVAIERGSIEDVDAVAGLWIELAEGQRPHGTHLLAGPNRTAAADAVARAAVSGGLLVATARGPDRGDDDGDDLVGFVSFGREDGRYAQDVARGVVYNLYVRPAYRDRGVGSRLLERAEALLADGGADVVSLEAMAANTNARRFYERHGYALHRVELEKHLPGAGSDSN
ncbi:GNAT family N-acetyltransferase [Halobaculum litoreum]|uniref:GNAT family N-acetyltransferase n=1 Tax=Halobaculum litoreum TaxID=3031998 RepID=UPI0024C23AAD|nr:GNAT family N-acetyltransferase [Halobaculum sp. DT92]